MKFDVLDHGYVELIDVQGSDERIIEAARMSTGKGFKHWGALHDERCSFVIETLVNETGQAFPLTRGCCCTPEPGDEKLLSYLWKNQHTTPFEQCGFSIKVQAPLVVFREWHRHRTQSYNEFSARYSQMEDLHYLPTLQRIKLSAGTNKQAQGLAPIGRDFELVAWTEKLENLQRQIYRHYEEGLHLGIPKEVARLNTPVSRYSRMVANANLLNWLRFLKLRLDHKAQFEIRQYATAIANIVAEKFPKTYDLFIEDFDKWIRQTTAPSS